MPIDRPNEYDYRFLEERPVLLKIHGTKGHPVVITEDHYIDYLADEAFTTLPKRLLSRICNSHLLCLGYSLRDWNFRVFLRRITRNRTHDFTSWAVVNSTDDEETTFWWERARVAIQLQELSAYAATLKAELQHLGVAS
ncbi:MAG: SIR2 family protein [Vicinamibacterales bacterium]